MPRPVDPITLQIWGVLDSQGDIPFSKAIEHLPGVERRKFDAAKMGWKAKKSGGKKKGRKTKKVAAAKTTRKAGKKTAKRQTVVQTSPGADLRRVASPPLTEALAYVKNHGGLAKLEQFVKEAQEQISNYRALQRQMAESA